MSEAFKFKIDLTPEAKRIVANLQTLPPKVVQSIARAMDLSNQLAIAKIQTDHLTGRGPYPVDQHKLGVVTSRLRGSVRASAATIHGETVETAIGSNVVYAAIHEFGGRVHHEARTVKVRLRTDAKGNLLRQLSNSHLAIFASRTHKRAKEVTSKAEAYDVDMPERAPFRTGIEESLHHYKRFVSAGIVAAWNDLKN
jgi:phage gpG-like protein